MTDVERSHHSDFVGAAARDRGSYAHLQACASLQAPVGPYRDRC